MSLPSAVLEILSFAWKAYQFARDKMREAEFITAQMELNTSLLKLKDAKSEQEKKDAATALARAHRDILK